MKIEFGGVGKTTGAIVKIQGVVTGDQEIITSVVGEEVVITGLRLLIQVMVIHMHNVLHREEIMLFLDQSFLQKRKLHFLQNQLH